VNIGDPGRQLKQNCFVITITNFAGLSGGLKPVRLSCSRVIDRDDKKVSLSQRRLWITFLLAFPITPG
jgi:hypothetical protein